MVATAYDSDGSAPLRLAPNGGRRRKKADQQNGTGKDDHQGGAILQANNNSESANTKRAKGIPNCGNTPA